jgi:hypothetical protein
MPRKKKTTLYLDPDVWAAFVKEAARQADPGERGSTAKLIRTVLRKAAERFAARTR